MVSSIGIGQVEKGNFLIGGQSQISSVDYGLSIQSTFHLSHELGYMFTDRLLIGGGVKVGGDDSFTGIHSLLRYYFLNRNQQMWFIGNRTSWVDYTLGAEVDLGYSTSLSSFLVFEVRAFYHHQRPFPRGFINNQAGLEAKLQLFINKKWQAQHSEWTNILQQGTWMIGGTAGKLFYEKGYGESTSLQLRPNVGMMWTDRLLLGGQLSADFRDLGSRKTHFNTLALIPFARHYFPQFFHRTIGFLEGGYGFLYESWKMQEIRFEEIEPAYFGALGFNSFISPEVAFELKGGYKKLGRQEQRWSLEMGFQLFLE
ncbi:MAG: hypothetical protein KTR30_09855 [Saprospiraceae bacterium]|nr:hypothetical protein [Saprospiraceae bacterium]